jgi:transposase
VHTTEQELTAVAKRLEQVSVADDVQYEQMESKADTVRQLERERAALNASRKLLNELLSKAQEDAVARAAAAKENPSMKVKFGSQTSGFQIGVSNAPISGTTFGGK